MLLVVDIDMLALAPQDTSDGGLLLQRPHRQELVKLVRDVARKHRFDPTEFALKYDFEKVKQEVASRAAERRTSAPSTTTK